MDNEKLFKDALDLIRPVKEDIFRAGCKSQFVKEIHLSREFFLKLKASVVYWAICQDELQTIDSFLLGYRHVVHNEPIGRDYWIETNVEKTFT